MRLLTKKTHRAYPELDKFDDDVCKQYVNGATKPQDRVFVAACMFISCVAWMVIGSILALMVHNLFRNVIGFFRFSEYVAAFFMLLPLSGVVWIPLIIRLIIRDRWLHRCIRKQLAGVQCGACGYSLLGLTITNEHDTPSVHCPECGHHLILKDMGLTQTDIDPNYQPATP